MTKNLVPINGKAIVAWTYRNNPGTTFSSRSEPYFASIKDYFYANEIEGDGTGRVWVTVKFKDDLNHTSNYYFPSYNIYIIKKGKNYYIDTNSKSFNNYNKKQQERILKYLGAKIVEEA